MSIIKPVRQRRAARGVTLIELIVFIIIVSVGVLGILSVLNVTTRASADPMVRKQAMTMAEAVLEEILSKSATATLPETDMNTCAARSQYVGVNDYACFDGAPATAVISGVNTLGAAQVPSLAAFSATVAIAAVNVSGQSLLRVTVTVTGANQTISLFGYRATGL
jgi:MSHA pilin protein MshD